MKSRSPHTKRLTVMLLSMSLLAQMAMQALPVASAGADPVPNPAASPGVVGARPVDGTVQFIDGEVRALTQVGSTVVAGGTFTQVGPANRGAAGLVDTTASAFRPTFPRVDGAVLAAAPDGSGGFYLGGSFTSVNGESRGNVAQVAADGTLTPFNPAANGAVRGLALTSHGLVLGGDFTSLAGTPSTRLANVDPISGALRWTTAVNGRIRALRSDGDRVYLGGEFIRVGTTDLRRLAAVDAATGAVRAEFAPGIVNYTVNDLELANGSLWLAGAFVTVNGQSRQRLASVNPVTGALLPFAAGANGDVLDIAFDASGVTMYAVGRFFSVAGVSRKWVAAVATSNGAVQPLALPSLGAGEVSSVAVEATGAVVIGGSFTIVPEKLTPSILARVDPQTSALTRIVHPAANPLSLTRTPFETTGVKVLVPSGADLLVAGDFSDHGTVGRAGLAAYDATTRALLPFNPGVTGAVNTVVGTADGSGVYAGGDFTQVGGTAQARLAKLDLATSAVDPAFSPVLDAFVKEVLVGPGGTRLFVGGGFGVINGQVQSHLAALDPITGSVLPGIDLSLTDATSPATEGGLRAMAISADGTRLVVIGNFRFAAGLERPLVAQIDLTTPSPTVTSWRTDLFDRPCSSGLIGRMRDVAISPDGTVLYIVTAGHFYYPACDTVNALSTDPADADVNGNMQPIWLRRVGDTIETVAATGDAVYIGGHFRYLEAETTSESRFQIAAVDPRNGDGLNWVPNADGFRGVLTLEVTPSGLLVGSDGDSVGQIPHGRHAVFALPSPGLELFKRPLPDVVVQPGELVEHRIEANNTYADRSITLSSLADTRLGSLDGVGTCALPQVIAPLGRYTCTASETVTGADLEVIAATVTGVGTTSLGGTLADSDRSEVEVKATNLKFRVRIANGPLTVPFPGGPTQIAISALNINQVQPVTLTSLTSPTLGDLNGQGDCVVPTVIPPRGTYWCSVDAVVSGSIGSRPSTSISGQVVTSSGSTLSSSASVNTTIGNPISGGEALLVVDNPAALQPAEVILRDRLDDTLTVVLADDNTVSLDDTAGRVVVVIGPNVVATRIAGKLRDTVTPLVALKWQLYDDLGLTGSGADQAGIEKVTNLTIVDPLHQLSAGSAGTPAFVSAERDVAWLVPGGEHHVVADVAPGQAGIVAWKRDALGADGLPLQSCRVAFPAIGQSLPKLSATGFELFDRAVSFAMADCGRGLMSTIAGNGTTTYPGDGFQSTGVGLSNPWGVVAHPEGGWVVTDAGRHAVRWIHSDGIVTTIAGSGTSGSSGDGGPATSARLNAPTRSAFDAAGNLYIADAANHRIRRVDPGGTISTVAGTGTAGYSGDGGPATAARLRSPWDVEVGPDGRLWVADRDNHRIRVFVLGGNISTAAGTGSSGYNGDEIQATSARLSSPHGIDVASDGSVYIADSNSERVRLVSLSGVITTVAGNGVASNGGDGGPANQGNLHKPYDVLVAPDGSLWIGESNNNRVRVVADGTMSTFAGTGLFGFSGDGGSPIFARFYRPIAMAFDEAGNLAIVDRENRRLRMAWAS